MMQQIQYINNQIRTKIPHAEEHVKKNQTIQLLCLSLICLCLTWLYFYLSKLLRLVFIRLRQDTLQLVALFSGGKGHGEKWLDRGSGMIRKGDEEDCLY